ncbi:MAG: 1-pyrroline-5-carboxylate dehydrogenase [Thermoplasmata archaeon]|jgi:1-pyrroline-5-carboxylate dehydrogenase|nr:1-pyrroline-5-carboxylate dehydrogenase [Thermoplasmata archaeon]
MAGFENQNTVFRVAQAGKGAELDREFEEAVAQLRKRAGEALPMLVAGKEVRHAATFDDLDPSTGEALARFPKGTAADVDAAVKAAKAAQPAWEALGWEKRAAIFDRAAQIMVRERPMLAALMCVENGKNRVEAYYDVDEAIDFLHYYAWQMREHKGYVVPMGKPFPDETCVSVMRPWGVFAVVGPFNFPVAIPTGMTTGALITGNAVVLKPASDTPWTSYELVRILHEAGVPKDALSLVTGGGREVGQPLIDHPDVGGLVFTGSRDVGMRNYPSFVGRRPRPYIAEMGGKNATVVTKNADLDKAATGVVKSAFGFGGQKCSATSRVYVHESIHDAFLAKLGEKARALRVEMPWKKEADLGPVINKGAVETFEAAVAAATKAGGKLLVGGHVIKEGAFAKGNFVQPTIVTGLPLDHEAFRQEYFVPFVAVGKFHDNEQVVREVNAADYGLTFGVVSNDANEVQWFFDRIEAGVVYANRDRGTSTGAMVGGQSFGGWKFSATTDRGAGGPWYLTQFLREQSRTYAGNTKPPQP